MIYTHSNDNKNEKALKKVCKKLKIEEDGVRFCAYEKFFFSYLFAFAIKDKKVYVFATDENATKDNVFSTYDISEVAGVKVDGKADFNLYLKNGNFINLTSIVSVSANGKKMITNFNDQIKAAR